MKLKSFLFGWILLATSMAWGQGAPLEGHTSICTDAQNTVTFRVESNEATGAVEQVVWVTQQGEVPFTVLYREALKGSDLGDRFAPEFVIYTARGANGAVWIEVGHGYFTEEEPDSMKTILTLINLQTGQRAQALLTCRALTIEE